MLRTYKRKTNGSDIDEGLMKYAVEDVLSGKFSISRPAKCV